jgi:phosphate/sulfate permease
MELYYILILGILIALAISDLVVGVSNDAVNFLLSAIGSKAASFKVIMIIATLGIIVGATFSSGMMEVARKGIFHPDQFFFNEIMIIFLAVMLTDVILLDFFNTIALPTSTTVSIVFELLGAAVAISLVKVAASDTSSIADMSQYINTSSALIIITGILLSVVVAFTVGMIIQYIVRIFFSFNYEKNIRNFGALWGGFAISAITYFILIKGAKGSSFMDSETIEWINGNTFKILFVSFIGWSIILQLANWIFRLNILKFIVLVGTFALAMAFAGNDLVNFIGVPLAGLESFRSFMDSGISDPSAFSMISLSAKVMTPTLFLLIAGVIMVVALWTSKKARSVSTTTLNLGRQDEGYERFDSSAVARSIVRGTVSVASVMDKIIPKSVGQFLSSRFDQNSLNNQKKEAGVSWDLVRASVNLVVASILIAFATSLKLPLSTTYVTFMVAMGTSLADGAWGRESAVYRVSGVVTVIGGWFFTAFSAFSVSMLIAYLIHLGNIYAVIGLLGLAIFFFIKTHGVHRKRDDAQKKAEESSALDDDLVNGENIFISCNESVYQTLSSIAILYSNIVMSLIDMKRKNAKRNLKEIIALNKETKKLKNNIHKTITQLQEDDIETGHFYVQVLDYLRETAHCLTFIAEPAFDYIDNNHHPLHAEQQSELKEFSQELNLYFSDIIQIIKKADYEKLEKIFSKQTELLDEITNIKKKQFKRIKKQTTGTKNSTLYLNTITESKNLILYCVNLLKAQRDFVQYNKSNHTS